MVVSQIKLTEITPNSITREYQCSQKECLNCSLKQKCITEKSPMKRIQVNIFEEVVNKNHEKDGSLEHTQILNLRQIWSERSFAIQKAQHNLKYLYRRG